ncbi:hypothetical protein FBY04_12010 [Pseudomonas sp. SJZ080]|uniref:hypothetical protein n=1 Tax=Pseudomonas sp. SJZ080 TaxID=2572888 RepID=UPI001199C027|nr:hypothetical protein [Pseudomonas sp. SJZ080]TWC50117.1 hypothetical protein FBY04_12010 [Pseudomonas sp. SJZ080]
MAAGAAFMAAYGGYIAVAAAVAGTAYSVYSSQQAGKQADQNAKAQAEQSQLDADAAASASVVQADRIRRLARNQASEANAALAGSGVEVGEGTAININEEIYGNAEEDAALTIFNGQAQKARGYADSSNIRMQGAQARQAANSQAIGSVLNTGASLGMSGWKAAANGQASKPGGAAV